MTIQLYYSPGTASLIPHILLEEMGVPFELVEVDREHDAHKSPDYLRLNPAGLIPVLVDSDHVLAETAAIVLALADRFPEKRMAPPCPSPAREQCYRWLMYLTNTLQAELIHYFYPHRLGGEHAEAVQARARDRIMPMLDILDAQLAQSTGPFFLGADYSIVDIYLFVLCRWTRNMPQPARLRPHLSPFLARMVERPAVRQVLERERLPQPWY